MTSAKEETEGSFPLVKSDIYSNPEEANALQESPSFQSHREEDPRTETSVTMPRLDSEELEDDSSCTTDFPVVEENSSHGDGVLGEQHHEEDGTADAVDPLAEEEEEKVKPVPKKRGRPPKKAKTFTPRKTMPSSLGADKDTAKMKPGKTITSSAPAGTKRQTRSAVSGAQIEAKEETDTEACASFAPAPKRRGRPSKAQKAEAAETTKTSKAAKVAAAGNDEYAVERIVGSIIDADNVHFYQVKWKGYPTSENTWEPKRNLGNCKELITAFEKQQQTDKRKKA